MTSPWVKMVVVLAMVNTIAIRAYSADKNSVIVNSNFRIIDVTGVVLLWEPFAVEWKTAEVGMEPPGGSLLQVRPSSTVSLKVTNQKGIQGLGEADVTFKVNKPTIGRLNDEYLRRIEIDRLYIDKLPDIKEIEKELKDPRPFYSLLDEAWNRVAAVFSGDEVPIKALEMSAQNKPDEDFELTVKQKKIEILSPHHDASLTTDDSGTPIERFVYWKPDSDDKIEILYDVFLWEKGTTRGESIGSTSEQKFKIELQPGVYQLQIVSRDKKFSSEVNTLTVLENSGLSEGLNGVKLKRDEVAEKDRLIELVSPPDDFYQVVLGEKSSMFFSWSNDRDSVERRKFRFLIKTNTGKIVFQKITYERDVRLSLKPGNYRWWVEAAHVEDGQQSPVRSEARILNIGRKKKGWVSQLKSIMDKEGGIIYVDDKGDAR